MGCFSYICDSCEENIREADEVRAYLIEQGEVVEEHRGYYDLYGRVAPTKDAALGNGEEWSYKDWGDLVDMHFGEKLHTGFNFRHEKCAESCTHLPVQRSKDDPNQGEPDYEDEEEFWDNFVDEDTDAESGIAYLYTHQT